MSGEYRHIKREFGPVYDEHSRILILGSFPSVKSREVRFFYGHPQNRFWPLIARLMAEPVPQSIDEKKAFLLRNKIALWDSIEECDIIASSDSSIRNAVPVDIMQVLRATDIKRIYANGAASAKVYDKYLKDITGMEAVSLPSTSPANAAWNLDRLAESWSVITKDLT